MFCVDQAEPNGFSTAKQHIWWLPLTFIDRTMTRLIDYMANCFCCHNNGLLESVGQITQRQVQWDSHQTSYAKYRQTNEGHGKLDGADNTNTMKIDGALTIFTSRRK